MKFFSGTLFFFLSTATFAQTSEVGKKIEDINAEIVKINKYQSEGVSSSIFEQQLKMLEKEKKGYQNLLKQEQISAARAARDEKKTSKNRAEIKDKKFPTALKNELASIKNYQDESIPLEKRYDLILEELQNMYQINSKLGDLKDSEKNENVIALLNSNRQKIEELEGYKLKYEIKIRENDQNDLVEMKKSGLRIGGMFDGYYQWDFNKPARVGNNGAEIPYKNYTNRHNDFTINLAEINLYKSYKNLDFYADIDFGEQTEQNESVSADAVTHHIGQAFLRYKSKNYNNLTFTAGKFYSHFGLEVPKNIENRTYSRPFYFYLICPFWHEGVSLTQSGLWDGNLGYGVYIYDKSDDRVDNDSDKTYGLQVNYAKGNFAGIYNLITGSEQNDTSGQTNLNQNGKKKTMHEIILTHNTTESVTLVFDAVVGNQKGYDSTTGHDSSWVALVGYADFKLTHNNSLNFRYENFKDLTPNGAASTLFYNAPAGTGNAVEAPTVDSLTLTNRYVVGNGSEVRLEYRVDVATKEIFPGDKFNEYERTQNTVTLGWLYSI